VNMWLLQFRSHEFVVNNVEGENLTNPKGDMSCFSQSVSMTKRNNIMLLKNNSRLHTEVESVSFLSRAKIVYQGVAEVNLKFTYFKCFLRHSHSHINKKHCSILC
jgi:hypothetical protein